MKAKTGILVSDKCLIWTDAGLLHVNELIPDTDNLLCINHNGEIEPVKLTKGVSLDGPRTLVNLITENCSTVLTNETEIFLSTGNTKIKNINKNDKIELIDTKQISQIKSIINKNVDDRLSLLEQEVIILGYFDFKVKKFDQTIFYTRNEADMKTLVRTLQELKEVYDDTELQAFQSSIFQNKSKSLLFKSEYFTSIAKKFAKDDVPVELRRSKYTTMKKYYDASILKNHSLKAYTIISTNRNQHDKKTFLQIMAQFEGRKVNKKIKDEWIEIKIMDLELQGSEKHYSKVLDKFESEGPAYNLELPPGLEPIIDNFMVKKHLVPYEIPD